MLEEKGQPDVGGERGSLMLEERGCQGCQWRPVVSTQHAVNVLDLETLTVAGVSFIT
ncbi:hypothetical protein KUCAC02_006338, partial [Chaenocephalus aceratus]